MRRDSQNSKLRINFVMRTDNRVPKTAHFLKRNERGFAFVGYVFLIVVIFSILIVTGSFALPGSITTAKPIATPPAQSVDIPSAAPPSTTPTISPTPTVSLTTTPTPTP